MRDGKEADSKALVRGTRTTYKANVGWAKVVMRLSHSSLIDFMKRSANAFRFGERAGNFTDSIPDPSSRSRNSAVNRGWRCDSGKNYCARNRHQTLRGNKRVHETNMGIQFPQRIETANIAPFAASKQVFNE